MALKTPTVSADTSAMRERYELGVHTINNANPYQVITVTEGHGKYPVIFEPLQNVQTLPYYKRQHSYNISRLWN